ncbi:hypothetical protein GIB67_027193 [Kingdonia uniflora]|uniref:Uncharacterized protein n=1 Tax=Kingdonia uniflora TaxID=39325 RepID=A0A7J7LBD0_9MAGN|nr:hypothetical protein GIB67_027193 [Kingdonia uniflora]
MYIVHIYIPIQKEGNYTHLPYTNSKGNYTHLPYNESKENYGHTKRNKKNGDDSGF